MKQSNGRNLFYNMFEFILSAECFFFYSCMILNTARYQTPTWTLLFSFSFQLPATVQYCIRSFSLWRLCTHWGTQI